MTEKNFNETFIAFGIRQGGIQHDRIAELNVVDVEKGEIKEVYWYKTSPDNLSDIWVDLADLFAHREYAIAYNLTTHRSNLEKSLQAVGVEPPAIKYLCAYNWGSHILGLTDSGEIQRELGFHYSGAESVVDIVRRLTQLSGLTIAERYEQIHRNHRGGTVNYFKGMSEDADLAGLVWAEGLVDPATYWAEKTVVITGDLAGYPNRTQLAEVLTQLGAKVVSAISGKTTTVIVGAGAGPSKLNKVRDLLGAGKPIVCLDEEFLKLILEP